ncbi:MAG: exodeoxyribonuclease VII large subunit [Planctomycetes bacterium]|nr:exodeoxyribonuclease VII large subunit [Planctomycetota bacterium]
MSGSVELDPGGSHLLIRFPYREDLVALVKDLPGRRWDPRAKTWRIPAEKAELVYTTLSRHLFEFAPEVMSIVAGTLAVVSKDVNKDEAAAPSGKQRTLPLTGEDPAAAGEPQALTIEQLNTAVRDGLRSRFPEAIWVVGEIVDFDKSAGRQHRFFALVDKAEGQARAQATVEVALFAGTAERLLPRLAGGEQPLTLRDGIQIRALVKVDLYVASGRFQVVISDIDPSFTLGKLALSREQILAELAAKGLAERNRARGFPVPALRVGLLTSPDSDGCTDFVRHLQESGVGFEVTLVPIKVQGAELKPTLLAGLRWFAQRADDFDVLCIVRGGGSRTDLAWFDDRDVAIAVAQHPLKIVVGIGHQRDQSVLDAIAHSAKTPTAVAELLAAMAPEARSDLTERARQLQHFVEQLLGERRAELADTAYELRRGTDRRLGHERALLARTAAGLQAATRLCLSQAGAQLRATAVQLGHASRRRLDHAAARLEQNATRQRLLDPGRVLQRGYALVRDGAGAVVPDAARLSSGAALAIHFRDGRVTAHVDDVHTESS